MATDTEQTTAEQATARQLMQELAARHTLSDDFPKEVEEQVAGFVRETGIDANDLVDLTGMPFVTIDGPGTRDLDQALAGGEDTRAASSRAP